MVVHGFDEIVFKWDANVQCSICVVLMTAAVVRFACCCCRYCSCCCCNCCCCNKTACDIVICWGVVPSFLVCCCLSTVVAFDKLEAEDVAFECDATYRSNSRFDLMVTNHSDCTVLTRTRPSTVLTFSNIFSRFNLIVSVKID